MPGDPAVFETLRDGLEQGIHPRRRHVDAERSEVLLASIRQAFDGHAPCRKDVLAHLIRDLHAKNDHLSDLQERFEFFNRRQMSCQTRRERESNLLNYALELGASPRQLRGDRRAFRRWFDNDALVARYQRRRGETLYEIVYLLDRLGNAMRDCLAAEPDPRAAWKRMDLESLIRPLLGAAVEGRVAEAACRCLNRSLDGVSEDQAATLISPGMSQVLFRCTLDVERDTWLQSEAIAVLRRLSGAGFGEVARNRFGQPGPGDDFFVRSRLVPLAMTHPVWPEIMDAVLGDDSPFVRQTLARSLTLVSGESLRRLLFQLVSDSEPAVRAAALLETVPLAGRGEEDLAQFILSAIDREQDAYVLRVALHVAAEGHRVLSDPARTAWREQLLPALRRVHGGHDSASLRRWAALARERIWCDAEPDRAALLERIREAAGALRPGESTVLRDAGAMAMDEITLGRIFSVAAQTDFGFELIPHRKGVKMVRGHRFGFRLWRWLHEFRNPSPDKRQAHAHTTGRVFEPDGLHVPSELLAETSLTKVPGEPLNLDAEAGWRPWLPLLDEVISALDENSPGVPLRLVTGEGVTSVLPPRGRAARWKARWRLVTGFAGLARKRNAEKPGEYVQALRELGFEFSFSPHEGESSDPAVASACNAFTGPLIGLAGLDLAARFQDYFYSVYENSLVHLLIFIAAATLVILFTHFRRNRTFSRMRKAIPLVIGGWGTRGKSGTERIKAALFNAIGYRTVSKTTGCEAMFLYAEPFGKLHELFLFRPYDKATIWEQLDIFNLSAELGSQVFLWECMALTPEYVEILQRQWMRDDLSTIVNTHPDHEDLQGPAGYNVAEVMNRFVRSGGHVLTSEQHMTPILRAEANRVGSQFDEVDWIAPGLLTPDVLGRFPYAEHPNNIALVAHMGECLGVPADFALKEMADRVVPDLGVLKVYPVAGVHGRRLQFVNGCSANERLGALGNWKRMEFDTQDPVAEPGVWITAVVNNRADRVARSRVFAQMIVEDLSADRFYFIGSNLDGMIGYVWEAFDAWAEGQTLVSDAAGPEEVLEGYARRMRMPTSEVHLDDRIEAMDAEGRDVTSWVAAFRDALREYQDLCRQLHDEADPERLNHAFRSMLRTWMASKLVVFPDYHATGDEIVHRIAEDTPPGYLNRIMGMQNIKGTGLDFVYRWQAWDLCSQLCTRLCDLDPEAAREGLAELAVFKEIGVLSEEALDQALTTAASMHGALASFEAQLEQIRGVMEETLAKIRMGIQAGSAQGGRARAAGAFCIQLAESFLDAGDAVRRRRKANRIYRDLADERISPARAAREIQVLNKRQKGGWLKRDLLAFWLQLNPPISGPSDLDPEKPLEIRRHRRSERKRRARDKEKKAARKDPPGDAGHDPQ